jgi:acyl-CoA dehydrogenase
MMVSRGLSRDGFGQPLAKFGGNTEMIAKARVWVSAVKAMVPIRVCEIIDQAIQMHGRRRRVAVDAAG